MQEKSGDAQESFPLNASYFDIINGYAMEIMNMIDKNNPYETGMLENVDISTLQATFPELPADPYADDRLRSRCYSRFKMLENGALERRSHKEFMQTSDINDYVGDLDRKYEEIPDHVMQNQAFLEMFKQFITRTNISSESIIEAHQIRWHCHNNIKMPAPEGNHQDGFDYIAIFLVNQKNVDGGEIMAFPKKESPPIFKKRLEAGEYVVLNDRDIFHNASPLVPTVNSDGGFWDLIVLTANDAA